MKLAVLTALVVFAAFPAVSAPPEALKPYIVSGTLMPGDFEWLRGSFADASAEQKAKWSTIKSWSDNITVERTNAMRDKLRAMGVDPQVKGARAYGDLPAAMVGIASVVAKEFKSWGDFQAALKEAEPAFDGYLAAMESAELVASRRSSSLSATLQAAVVGDQIGRNGMQWGLLNKPTDKPCIPVKLPEPTGCSHLSDPAAEIFNLLIIGEVKKRDHADTEMLKGIVAKNGWPKISDVGKDAADDAWLLAQHADDDPAFQLQVLRLMEPLVAKKEVSGENYAYLRDRVSLAINGTQRYGTQLQCKDGFYQPYSLQEPEHLGELRKSVGLGPVEKAIRCD